MSDDPDPEIEWGYAETILVWCPTCDLCIAIETDPAEFSGARCVTCDTRLLSKQRRK